MNNQPFDKPLKPPMTDVDKALEEVSQRRQQAEQRGLEGLTEGLKAENDRRVLESNRTEEIRRIPRMPEWLEAAQNEYALARFNESPRRST